MYPRPHLICVVALFAQSGPAEAILLPGKACGMPYAPLGLLAWIRHPLSWFHRVTRQEYWSSPQPRFASRSLAIAFAEPGLGAGPLGADRPCVGAPDAEPLAAAAVPAVASWTMRFVPTLSTRGAGRRSVTVLIFVRATGLPST